MGRNNYSMNRGQLKRKKLFDLYSQNLKNLCEIGDLRVALVDSETSENTLSEAAILCPLCMKAYTEEALNDYGSDNLTLEHIPPKSVGGKEKLLTCRLCNEMNGKELDHHIQSVLNVEPFLRKLPNSHLEGKMRINGSLPFKAKLSFEEKSAVFTVIRDKNTQDQYDRVRNEIEKSWDGTKAQFKSLGINLIKNRIALIKSAYLEMFTFFGHSFLLFNGNSYKIREQIRNPGKSILPHCSIVDQDFDKQLVGVNIIHSPLDKLAFLVVLNLKFRKQNYERRIGVLMPGPDKQAWETYCSFLGNQTMDIKLMHLSLLDCIKERNLTFLHQDIWVDAKNNRLTSIP